VTLTARIKEGASVTDELVGAALGEEVGERLVDGFVVGEAVEERAGAEVELDDGEPLPLPPLPDPLPPLPDPLPPLPDPPDPVSS
jgi:hypothetical protein